MTEVKEIIVATVRNGDKLLILHRQPGKKYDPDRWEFVSAFVEGDLSLQEFTQKQVLYETGLDADFARAGKDFKVFDEYGEWLIHPFLFETKSDSVVLKPTDHSEYKFVLSEDLKLYPTVKDLDKNLQALDLAAN